MLTKKTKQFRIIDADNAAGFQSELNAALIELASYEPVVDTDVKAGYRAFISYEIKTEVPETISEQFQLKGISYKCSNCPNCTRITKTDGTVDNRKKKAICSEYGTCYVDSPACELFYEKLVNDEIEVIE